MFLVEEHKESDYCAPAQPTVCVALKTLSDKLYLASVRWEV